MTPTYIEEACWATTTAQVVQVGVSAGERASEMERAMGWRQDEQSESAERDEDEDEDEAACN